MSTRYTWLYCKCKENTTISYSSKNSNKTKSFKSQDKKTAVWPSPPELYFVDGHTWSEALPERPLYTDCDVRALTLPPMEEPSALCEQYTCAQQCNMSLGTVPDASCSTTSRYIPVLLCTLKLATLPQTLISPHPPLPSALQVFLSHLLPLSLVKFIMTPSSFQPMAQSPYLHRTASALIHIIQLASIAAGLNLHPQSQVFGRKEN